MTKVKDDAPVTFIPKATFTGFPDGKTATEFVAGQESCPVTPEYLLLLKEKGLVSDNESTSATVKA